MIIRTGRFALVCLTTGMAGALLALAPAATLAGHQDHAAGDHHAPMDDAAMRRWADAWWASHPRVGASASGVPSATFTVQNFRFDLDNNAATQVDTAKINVGQSVMWQWITGLHTTTNGVDGTDPNAGTLFDQPLDLTHQQFTFAFNTPGTYPFFCRPHDFVQMKGVVVVSGPTDVAPLPHRGLGFTRDPAPNPSTGEVRFDFALREPGRARVEVFDARGRRVAVALDRDLAAGNHPGAWDGRRTGGVAAGAGIYYLWLRLPGYQGSRAVAITR